jgi:hypothetical protein
MRTERSRSSTRTMLGLGACAAVVAAVSLGSLAVLAAAAKVPVAHPAQAALGSSCANPYILSVERGGRILIDTEKTNVIGLLGAGDPNGPQLAEWSTRKGYVVCSARVQLASGALVPPTSIFPYPMPTPLGGQYEETSDPASRYTAVTVTAAKSPVPAGTNCNYPLVSNISETIAHTGPRPPVTIKLVGLPPGATSSPTITLRLKVIPRKSHLVLCPKADINIWIEDAKGNLVGHHNYYVSVKPHGGLTSAITVPASYYRLGEATDPRLIGAAASARLVKGNFNLVWKKANPR